MSDEKKKRRSTLADAIDATEWDFKPGKDRKNLLKPVGAMFSDVPWEVEPQYLGPAPIAEPATEAENEVEDDDADTQPIEPMNK